MNQARNAPRELDLLTIEGLEFVYRRNFSGTAERFNDAGNRYFNAKIPDPVIAQALENDGWNIKWTKPGNNHPNPEEHVPEPYVEVTVGFKFRPPTIMMIRDGRGTVITEETVALLDSTEFSNIDVVIRPVHWQNDSGSGYKAYLKSFYGTVEMDDLARKYAYLSSGPTSDDSDEIADDSPPFEVN